MRTCFRVTELESGLSEMVTLQFSANLNFQKTNILVNIFSLNADRKSVGFRTNN